jgi:hypothetical protein
MVLRERGESKGSIREEAFPRSVLRPPLDSTHIGRRGSNELRAMLCEAAHHAGYRNNAFSPYFRQLCARRGYKMAVVAVAHRLCLGRKSRPRTDGW